MTLIEIMIVLAIVGAVVVMAMPYMNNRNAKTKAFLRQMTVLSRELHTRAKLQGTVYRLVFDLKDVDDPNKVSEQTYWVEKANGRTVLKANEEEAVRKALEESKDEKKADPRGFQIDGALTKEPRPIPSNLKIAQVELARLPRPITNGKAYIHYLPEGLTDEANILIKGQKTQAWTITIHPLTGKAELVEKALSLKDMKQ